MRVLVILILVSLALASHPSRPHAKGYHEAKQALTELANQLDALSFVLAAKGVKALPLCGLSVPNLGDQVATPLATIQAEAKAHAKAVAEAKAHAKEEAREVQAKKSKYARKDGRKGGSKYAVVRYPSKQALDSALLVAAAEIVADDTAVRAKVAKIGVEQLIEQSARDNGDVKKARSVEKAVERDLAAIGDIEAHERRVRDQQRKIRELEARIAATTVAPTEAAPTTPAATEVAPAATDAPATTPAPAATTPAPTTPAPTTPAPTTAAPTANPATSCRRRASGRAAAPSGETLYAAVGETPSSPKQVDTSAWPIVSASLSCPPGEAKSTCRGGSQLACGGKCCYTFAFENAGEETGPSQNPAFTFV